MTREEEKGYNIMQQTYIDSVDGAAHQSAVDIIGVAESRLAQEEKLHAEHNESARKEIEDLRSRLAKLPESKKEVVNLIFDAIPYSTLNKFKDRASIAKGMDKLATALWEKYHDT